LSTSRPRTPATRFGALPDGYKEPVSANYVIDPTTRRSHSLRNEQVKRVMERWYKRAELLVESTRLVMEGFSHRNEGVTAWDLSTRNAPAKLFHALFDNMSEIMFAYPERAGLVVVTPQWIASCLLSTKMALLVSSPEPGAEHGALAPIHDVRGSNTGMSFEVTFLKPNRTCPVSVVLGEPAKMRGAEYSVKKTLAESGSAAAIDEGKEVLGDDMPAAAQATIIHAFA